MEEEDEDMRTLLLALALTGCVLDASGRIEPSPEPDPEPVPADTRAPVKNERMPGGPTKDRTVRLFVADDVDLDPAVDWLEAHGVDCLVMHPLDEYELNDDPAELHVEAYLDEDIRAWGEADWHGPTRGRVRLKPQLRGWTSIWVHELVHVLARVGDGMHDEDPGSIFHGSPGQDADYLEPETLDLLLARACWNGWQS